MNPLPDMSGPPVWYDAAVLTAAAVGAAMVVVRLLGQSRQRAGQARRTGWRRG